MRLKNRNIIFITITLLALLVIVEVLAYLLLDFSILKNYNYPFFNRELSGYSLYKNSSGFEYENSIKRHEEETNPIINKFGFISGEELKYEKILRSLGFLFWAVGSLWQWAIGAI